MLSNKCYVAKGVKKKRENKTRMEEKGKMTKQEDGKEPGRAESKDWKLWKGLNCIGAC